MTNDRPSPRPPRSTQESPLVWALLVAIMLLAFLTFLFTALAEPTTYRAVLALAAGAFLVLSIVQLVRSSRERRRLREAASTDARDADERGNDGTDRPGSDPPGTSRPGDDTPAG
jgi:hypothetical protein